MLDLKDVGKRYRTEKGEPKGGVSDVTLEVKAGELFTLLGPSGCGKTTTLRSIAGLETPDEGVIRLGGETLFSAFDGTNVPMYERDIGMVFQSYAIWPHMSVFENAAYPLRVARRTRYASGEIERRVMRVLEMVGLAGFRRRSATQLSGGQQQRLALARALVREPKLLLLDEPLSNLDALLREQMRSEVKRIQSEWGVTAIYVTHDQSEAMALSDRIAVLDDGRIIQVGTPSDIYNRPRSEFVANFVGRTNLIRGRVVEGCEAGAIGTVDTVIGPIRCRFAERRRTGDELPCVVRPENIEIGRTPQNGGHNTFHGRVASRTYLGDIAEYTLIVEPDTEILARAHPSLELKRDEVVSIAFAPDMAVTVGS